MDWDFLHHHCQLLDKHKVEGEFRSPIVQKNAFKDEESIVCNNVAWASHRVFLLQTISNVSVEVIVFLNMHSTEFFMDWAGGPLEIITSIVL